MRTVGKVLRGFAARVKTAPPVAILAISWLVVIVYAYPGQMTQDSYDHLREVRDRVWTDGHPPALNAMWAVTDYVIAGPFGMLVVQTTLFTWALYLVFRRTFSPRRAAWATTGLFLFPPVMLVLPVIWKDSPMTGLLLLGAALLHAERRWVRIVALFALAAATALRYNAFAATFPLIVLVFEWRPGARWLRRYAIAFVAWIATTAVAFGFNEAIIDKKVHFWHSTLGVFDIVGTLAFVEEDLPDAELERLLAGTELRVHHDIHGAIRRIYEPDNPLPIVMIDKEPILWQLPINGYVPAPKAQRDAIERAYQDVITTYPAAYLKHRFTVMGKVLWLGEDRPAAVIRSRQFAFPDYHNQIGLGTGWSKLQYKMSKWMHVIWRTVPIFLPWPYLVAALLLLPLARRHRDVLALLLSGLALELSLLPLAATSDFRYSHWMILTVGIAVIVLTARRARAGRLSTASDTR